MKFAYADPPYFGCASRYDHPEAAKWDSLDAHRSLLRQLETCFPDGWALSCSVPSLPHLLPYFRIPYRICSWVKPFASFKPGVTLAYTWEPVVVVGGRKRQRTEPTCRDHLSEPIQLKKGLCGAKPPRFNQWILGLLNWQPGDALDDLFPGTGGMAEALALGIQDLGGPRPKVKPLAAVA